MAQANGSSCNNSRKEDTSNSLQNHLESLFANGTHYPDIPYFVAQLCVPEQCLQLAIWFEER